MRVRVPVSVQMIIEVNKYHDELPICVLGAVDTERGREIEEEMREWLVPNYHLWVVRHDGSQFEQPALRFAQMMSIEMERPVLYLHTKGAFNRQDLSDEVRKMWRHEFTENKDLYFGLVNRPYAVVACPFTGDDKTTWYNGFVANHRAYNEIPAIEPNTNRMVFERLFVKQRLQVIGVVRNDFHRRKGKIDEKFLSTWKILK